MKKLIHIGWFCLLMVGCHQPNTTYVALKGTITNPNSDSLLVLSDTFTKRIQVQRDGTFLDSLKVTSGFYKLYDGTEQTALYLENGFDHSYDFADHNRYFSPKNHSEDDQPLPPDAAPPINLDDAVDTTY